MKNWIKMQQWYDKEEDILNIQLDNKEYWKSVELGNGIVIDVLKDGSIVSIDTSEIGSQSPNFSSE